jgi:hypothetical protein
VSKLGFTVSLKGGFISLISKSKRIKETSGLDNSVYRASREERGSEHESSGKTERLTTTQSKTHPGRLSTEKTALGTAFFWPKVPKAEAEANEESGGGKTELHCFDCCASKRFSS